MKKTFRILTLVTAVSLFAVAKSQAQISISLQLHRPAQYEQNERVHPPRPSPNHIWITEEWAPNGSGNYNYVPGHWDLPPDRKYIPGSWQPAQGGGYSWVPGYWIIYAHGARVQVQ